jgi:hypothetical protein
MSSWDRTWLYICLATIIVGCLIAFLDDFILGIVIVAIGFALPWFIQPVDKVRWWLKSRRKVH